MKLKKKIILMILFIMPLILLLNTHSYAGTQSWNSLDYDVTVNKDGSMNVIETWDTYISETNTLFKSFDLGSDNYEIDNVKVSRVENGQEIPLKEIKMQQYHVDSGCFYGLMINDSTFEIAWNVGLDNSSDDRIYKMYYTVNNAVKIYNDCTELYWQFLSKENSMYGKNITGTIKLPDGVSDFEKLRVWAHGSYQGNIEKVSNNTVKFTQNTLRSNEMLEVRVVTEENIYTTCKNKVNINKIEEVLEEEMRWADEANAEREEAQELLETFKIALIVMAVVNVFILILFISKSKKYKMQREELMAQYALSGSYNFEYFRDIPDEKNATPAKAVYMYNFNKNSSSIQNKISKIFSATILNLSLKGLVAFENVDEKEIRISRTSNTNEENLSEDEKIVYDIIKDALIHKDSITTKELSKYASREYETVYTKLNTLDEIIKKEKIKENKISEEKLKISKQWNSKFGVFFALAIISFIIIMFLPAVFVGLIILATTCRKNATCFSILTENGEVEVASWKGLKKYMEEYSLLSDKLVPDIVLWEKYLVYATAFGISKKVIEQLKVVHPEMFEVTADNSFRNYAYWNMMTNSSFGNNGFEDFSKSLEKVYNSAQSAYSAAHSSSSSGSGAGGGFSGGGGGRRRRRKLRRSLNFLLEKTFKRRFK